MCVTLQVDLGRINALIAQNAGLKAMLEEEHLQLEVSALLALFPVLSNLKNSHQWLNQHVAKQGIQCAGTIGADA